MKRKETLVSEGPISQSEREWLLSVDEITTREMVEWLKAGVDLRRPIDNLNHAALSALAEIARAVYIRELSKRRDEIENLPPVEQQTQLDWLI